MWVLGGASRVDSGLFLPVFLLVALPCLATEPPQQLSLQEKTLAAEAFIGQKLAIWQNRLYLDDWKIAVRLVPSTGLKPKTLGNIHWDTATRIATIRILNVAEYRLPYREMLEDMEFTVVHELIHLQLSSLPRSEASRSAEERAVNQITQALLNLDRKK